jgi:hypothetical protein
VSKQAYFWDSVTHSKIYQLALIFGPLNTSALLKLSFEQKCILGYNKICVCVIATVKDKDKSEKLHC